MRPPTPTRLPDPVSFHWVTPALALGGRLPVGAEMALVAEHGIAAVVDLRAEDGDDAAALAAAKIAFLHLPTPDHHSPVPADLERGVRFVRERLAQGERVLIHCEHGIGRSAVLMLCVLVDGGAEPLDALRRAKDAREKVSPSPMQYQGWAAWLASRGVAVPSFDAFGRLAYRHLAQC